MIIRNRTIGGKGVWLLSACMLALSLAGCAPKASTEPVRIEGEKIPEETRAEAPEEIRAEVPEDAAKETQTQTGEEEYKLTFSDLAGLSFYFSSGVGGWATELMIRKDGSFSGEFFDGEMGVTGEDYPNGTMYQSNFSGRFSQPVQVNGYTWSMGLEELKYEQELGTEEIEDGMRICYSDAYGLEGTQEFLIYLPGSPLEELPEGFLSWVGYYDPADIQDGRLPFYGLYNREQECGFSSFDPADGIESQIAYTEETAAALEEALYNDEMLTQTEMNQKAAEIYELWDTTLNELWKVLRQVKDETFMEQLTQEQRQWIARKEEAAAQAGGEYEGGTASGMSYGLQAAQMTRERVYELWEILKQK